MKSKLTLAGLFVATYTYFLITAFFYLFAEDVILEVDRNMIINPMFLWVILGLSIVIIPAHYYLVRTAYKKHDMDIGMAIPYFAIPYMLGVIAHTMIQ